MAAMVANGSLKLNLSSESAKRDDSLLSDLGDFLSAREKKSDGNLASHVPSSLHSVTGSTTIDSFPTKITAQNQTLVGGKEFSSDASSKRPRGSEGVPAAEDGTLLAGPTGSENPLVEKRKGISKEDDDVKDADEDEEVDEDEEDDDDDEDEEDEEEEDEEEGEEDYDDLKKGEDKDDEEVDDDGEDNGNLDGEDDEEDDEEEDEDQDEEDEEEDEDQEEEDDEDDDDDNEAEGPPPKKRK